MSEFDPPVGRDSVKTLSTWVYRRGGIARRMAREAAASRLGRTYDEFMKQIQGRRTRRIERQRMQGASDSAAFGAEPMQVDMEGRFEYLHDEL